jgi:hypothetical protein
MADPIADNWKAMHDPMRQMKVSTVQRQRLAARLRGGQRAHMVYVCDVCRNSKDMPSPRP